MSHQNAIASPPGSRAPAGDIVSSSLRHLAERMREDIRLAIVTLYTICVAATVGPFAVYRLLSAEVLVGTVDFLIIAGFVALALLAWRPERTTLAANCTAAVAAAAVVAVVDFLDLSPLWLFSTLVGNFLMAERRVALWVNSLMIGAIAMRPDVSAGATEHATLIAVAVMTSLFSLIFAARVHTQHRQLSRLAERDGLTGALNRRSLDRDLATLTRQSNRASGPHSLALLDMDDFKELNDTRGHEAGDRALVLLADVVAATTRGTDRFYRYGGEEFVLLLTDTPVDGARKALAKLREDFTASAGEMAASVTFSAGLAEHVPGESSEDWLVRADRALFRAKRGGKDRVEVE